MPDQQTQTHYSVDALTRIAFSIYGSPGVYALLVGSGLSRGAGIPTGWEVTLDLVRRLAIAQGENPQPDWAAWYRAKFDKEPNYSELVADLASSPAERQAILHGYIEPTSEDREEGRKVPTAGHLAIADLVHDGYVRVILTTNFDRLLENALRERGVEPTVIDSVDALHGAEPLTHTACHLVKLHGDYKDARIRNTDAELAEYSSELNAHLNRILDEHGLVVCGWSGEWDKALYGAIMRNPSRRYSLYWAARGSLQDHGERIIAHRSGHLVPIVDADDFLGKLRDRVQTIAQTRRRDPRSVELLVESTKRFIARPEYAIELNDLLESEVRRLQQLVEKSTPQATLDAKGVQSICAFYESASEPLGRMFGVLGRWGKGTEYEIVTSAFSALWPKAGSAGSGLHLLRYYPAVLLLWSYGVGLTFANQWIALYRLLSQSVTSDYRDSTSLAYLLRDWFRDGSHDSIWRLLPGYERHYMAAADHLFEVLDTWRDSYAALYPDFDRLHDIWEILIALAYCESEASTQSDNNTWFWAPIGRSGVRPQPRQQILERITGGDLRSQLLAAGFCAGNEEQLTATVKSYSNFINKIIWR